jgi:hypothetical protein
MKKLLIKWGILYALNMLDITIKYLIVAMFVTVNLREKLQAQCVDTT